jgi:hypothetical protein
MKATELVKGKVYTNLLDREIPLMFTGKLKKANEYGYDFIFAKFIPVKTEKNKNWFNDKKKYTERFCVENGNEYIKK